MARRRRRPPSAPAHVACAECLADPDHGPDDVDAIHWAWAQTMNLAEDLEVFAARWARACAGARAVWVDRELDAPGWGCRLALAERLDLIGDDLPASVRARLRPDEREVIELRP